MAALQVFTEATLQQRILILQQLVLPAGWGGFKRSGIGREQGPWGLPSYLEVKHLIGPTQDD